MTTFRKSNIKNMLKIVIYLLDTNKFASNFCITSFYCKFHCARFLS